MIAAHEVIREGVPDSEEKGIDRIKNDRLLLIDYSNVCLVQVSCSKAIKANCSIP